MSKYKIFIRDIFFVSKITGTKNKKIRILLSVMLLFLAFGCDLLIIVVIANLFESSNYSDLQLIQFLLSNLYLLPVIVVVRQIFGYLDVFNTFSLKFEVEQNLKVYVIKEVFDKGNFSIGESFHLMNNFSASVGAFYHALTAFIASFIQLILYAGYLIYTDAQTILVLVVGAAVIYLPTKIFTLKGRVYAHEKWEASEQYSKQVQKVLENIFLIKLLKKVNEELESFRTTLGRLLKAELNNQKVGTINTSFPQFAVYLLVSVLLAFFNFAKLLTIDFIGILVRLFQEFSKLNKNIMLVSNNHVVIQKLYEMEKNKALTYSENFYIDNKIDTAIKFEKVDFEYFNAENKIFENINSEIKKNSHTVVTGPNGSGKSTLLGLSAGLLFPQKGTVCSFSNKYAYVGVTPLIIDGTLRENILYGNGKTIEDKILIEYLESFKVFNEDINDNLDQKISNKTLSSGQLQKVAFIRSLLSEAEILLLDESTSNLDEASRKLIFNLLNNSEYTIINCTHNHQDFEYDDHLKIKIENEKRLIIR
ncbi:MAG: hypothetical protein CMI79_04205 [Candidatus Pelagibacter sp.]|nr:hypothetical protein [Candidatus Pelagibacter sp.]|tara:strand:+ start:694 stop:2295 length:1602 start_codon:yes stop_codon:yes gene_type:complete